MSAISNDETREWWPLLLAMPDVGLADLIDGFTTIAHQPVPYAQLPTRAKTAYSAQFRTWGEFRDETITSLLARPKIGPTTLQALIAAARRAVRIANSHNDAPRPDAKTAAAHLLSELPDRERALLGVRAWARRPLPVPEAAIQLGTYGAWIQRHQSRAQARLAELCASAAHHSIAEYVQELARRIGSVAREHTAAAALAELGLHEGSEAANMMLYLAGPYRNAPERGWIENRALGGWRAARAAVDKEFTRSPAPTLTALTRELRRIGMPREHAAEFVDTIPGLRRFGDRWARWGNTIADKAEAILHLNTTHTPTSIDWIAAALGEYSRRAVSAVLFTDPRFARVSRLNWGLRIWALPEYSSVFDAIAQRIDAGGVVAATELMQDVVSAFPDVAESSVRTYLASPAFVHDRGMVRRRSAADPWRAPAPLSKARGAFRNGANQVRLAISVNANILRGSGTAFHPAVADALDVSPGKQRIFTGVSDLVLKWRMSSSTGPTVGTLRPFAAAVNATAGDTLVLIFDTNSATVDVARITPDDVPGRQFDTLLGGPVRNARTALARSLSCTPDRIASVLRERGDGELAALIETPKRERTTLLSPAAAQTAAAQSL